MRSAPSVPAPRPRVRALCFMLLLGAGAALSGLAACGGKSQTGSDEDSDETSSDGSSSDGGSGGTGPSSSASVDGSTADSGTTTSTTGAASVSAATDGSGGVGSTSNGSGGAGGAPDACQLPIVAGPCDAYFPSWGFNVESGTCEEFTYGGCEGNDNRFETHEACLELCGPGRHSCDTPLDCVIDQGCCGFCDVDSVDDFEAVNREYAGYMSPVCELVDCDQCAAPPESEHFTATCNAGTCEVMDVRTSELSACTTDSDCRLRAGLSCCEDCSGTSWVAVSVDSGAVPSELCGPNPVPCPPCVPIYPPEDPSAMCGSEGHCLVTWLLR